jgi:proline iminopeptidase
VVRAARVIVCAAAGAAMLGARGGNEGYIASTDAVRLHYRVVGQGTDTIIAIHGGPGVDLESIAADFAPLAQRHVVIFYDQRGTGQSTLPADTARLSATAQIEDLEAVRRHFGLDRVTLVAHSYGPLLAATYALAYPAHVRRMVFFGPIPPRRGDLWERFGHTVDQRLDSAQRMRLMDANHRVGDPAADSAATRQACRDLWAIALRPRLADPDRTLPLVRSDLCAASASAIRYGLGVTNRVVMASYGDWDLRPRLRTLAVPTLVVYGEEEAIPADLVQEWVTSMPHARLVSVPHAAHFVYVEQPGVVWPVVERFLSEH